MRDRDQVELRLLALPMSELAVGPLAAALDEIFAHGVLELLVVVFQPS